MTRGFRVLFYDPPSRRCALLVFAFALSNGGAAVSLVMFPYYKHARARRLALRDLGSLSSDESK